MIKKIAVLLSLAVAIPACATVLVQENFESWVPGTRLVDFSPDWYSNSSSLRVGNQPGFAANGSQYLVVPSRTGSGDRILYGYFDASMGFNTRPSGYNTIIETVKMFIPNVSGSTYGGMEMYDQNFDLVSVIGVDMLTHRTLTNATSNINDIAVNLDQYNDIELLANYESGLVDYFFNGIRIGSRQMTAASMAAGFGDFDFYNNGFNATSSVAFRYDDYMVQAVPEPATIGLFGLGAFALLFNRRKTTRVCRTIK